MTRSASLVLVGLAFAGLWGADVRGCGGRPIPEPWPLPADGGAGTTGGGADGGCLQGCGSLDEGSCLARPDCAPVYRESGCTKAFDHCEARQCPIYECPLIDPAQGCVPVLDANGCATCECVKTCTTSGECPSGEVCAPDPRWPCQCPPNAECFCAPGPLVCQVPPGGCRSDADCGAGQVCEQSACPAGMPACADVPPGSMMPCCAPAARCVPAPGNCGALTCGLGQVCVHFEGGTQTQTGGGSWSACVAFPQQCATQASCDCVGQAVCGGAATTSCAKNPIQVTCQAP